VIIEFDEAQAAGASLARLVGVASLERPRQVSQPPDSAQEEMVSPLEAQAVAAMPTSQSPRQRSPRGRRQRRVAGTTSKPPPLLALYAKR